MKLGIDFLTGLLCKIWDRMTISIPLLLKGCCMIIAKYACIHAVGNECTGVQNSRCPIIAITCRLPELGGEGEGGRCTALNKTCSA